MIKRDITKRIKSVAKQFGVLSITGPRQSGKTTLVKKLFPKHLYINFENIATLDLVKSDPIKFIQEVKNGVIIDEVQKFPEILSYIQVSIDENFKPGKFILTGSQNLLLLNKVSQSLAGRVAIIKLLPLSLNELQKTEFKEQTYLDNIHTGFYPAIYDKKLDVDEYYNNYLNTYIERDVRTIQNIGDLSLFTKFLQLLAGRVGQLLNLSDLADSLGISHNTVSSWISILEASYIVYLLQPFFNNRGKRLIKSPKVYFYDVGVVCNLLRLRTKKELDNYYGLGNIFENYIVTEIYKNIYNTGANTGLYFFRDSNGNEVDLIIDKGTIITPIEIKTSHTFKQEFLKGLEYFQNFEPKSEKGFLVYTGEENWQDQLVNYKKISKIKV